MQTIVIDASVGAKWLFEEEQTEKADRLLDCFHKKEIRIIVPEIFYIEVASVCSKKVRRKFSSTKEAIDALDRTTDFSLVRYSDSELADVALENALQYKISVYDGLYLALAEIYVAPLVTADEVLLKACRGRFDFIESLSEFSLS